MILYTRKISLLNSSNGFFWSHFFLPQIRYAGFGESWKGHSWNFPPQNPLFWISEGWRGVFVEFSSPTS